MNYVITCIVFLLGERREEVIDVDIEGFLNMSNTSFKEHFRMDRAIFEVRNCYV